MKCIIVDDEPHARALLGSMLRSKHSELNIVGEVGDIDTAREMIALEKPDLVFLDVRIKDRLGFEILDAFNPTPFQVIFTTAYDEYAVDAFQYAAVHYLLKPYSTSKLAEAVERCKSSKQSPQTIDKLKGRLTDEDSLVSIVNRSGVERYHQSELLYFIGSGSYTEIYLQGGRTILASKSIGHFQKSLEEKGFLRCHKQFIINSSHVKSYEKGSHPHVIMTDGKEISVSRSHRKKLGELL